MGGIGEFNIILALGVLLAAGFVGAWLVRLLVILLWTPMQQ